MKSGIQIGASASSSQKPTIIFSCPVPAWTSQWQQFSRSQVEKGLIQWESKACDLCPFTTIRPPIRESCWFEKLPPCCLLILVVALGQRGHITSCMRSLLVEVSGLEPRTFCKPSLRWAQLWSLCQCFFLTVGQRKVLPVPDAKIIEEENLGFEPPIPKGDAPQSANGFPSEEKCLQSDSCRWILRAVFRLLVSFQQHQPIPRTGS